MVDPERKANKERMLEYLKNNDAGEDLTLKSSYKDIFEAYKEELEANEDQYSLYPNGLDYDAEDFDD